MPHLMHTTFLIWTTQIIPKIKKKKNEVPKLVSGGYGCGLTTSEMVQGVGRTTPTASRGGSTTLKMVKCGGGFGTS
jgi:hypothetical protein